MENMGFVLLHRIIENWRWYQNSEMFHFFMHCIMRANHTPKDWEFGIIQRGQFVTSLDHLSAETGLSIQKVRTCIKKLETTKEIVKKSTQRYTMITICNYDVYQAKNFIVNKPLTNEQQTNNKRITTTNNENNENNEKQFKQGESPSEFINVFKDCFLKVKTVPYEDKPGDFVAAEKITKYLNKINNYTPDQLPAVLEAVMQRAKENKRTFLFDILGIENFYKHITEYLTPAQSNGNTSDEQLAQILHKNVNETPEEAKQKFKKECENMIGDEYGQEFAKDFYDYWSQPDTNGLMNWQKEQNIRGWDLKTRFHLHKQQWNKTHPGYAYNGKRKMQ